MLFSSMVITLTILISAIAVLVLLILGVVKVIGALMDKADKRLTEASLKYIEQEDSGEANRGE